MENTNLKVVKDYVMPASTRGTGATGSKFFTEDIKTTLEKLNKGEAAIIPVMEGLKAGRQRTATAFRIKEYFKDTRKEFLIRMTNDGLAVQLINAPAPEAATKAPVKQGAKVAAQVEDAVEA